MIEVHITENDIVKAIKNTSLTPYGIALCRVFSCSLEQIEIKNRHINVWLNDDSSYVAFEFSTKEDRYLFEYFKDKWEEFFESDSEEFLESPIKIFLDGDDEALKVDCTRFIDRPSADKKNPKFRLTDDDK
jgi:hypothetical protein